jgi:hypothetical protein
MADRWRTVSGWSVEVVQLACTPDHHDGSWYRVRQHGAFVADVRTVADLERWLPLAELEPDVLRAA